MPEPAAPSRRRVLSVIVPVKNGAATLPRLLDALAVVVGDRRRPVRPPVRQP